jgi:hypothetical protein
MIRVACLVLAAGLSLSQVYAGVAGPSSQFDIRAYGAKADASDKATAAVQRAIKACAESGGGTVVIPAGTYIIGPLELVGNITLCLEAGAVLKGSENLADYSQGRGRRPLIWATNAENIAIVGRGIIDGSGTTFMDMTKTRTGPYLPKDLDPNFTRQGRDYMDAKFGEADGPVVYRSRPNRLIRFTRCKNVLVREVTLRNAPTWTLHFDDCENVTVTGLSIQNNLLVPNSDGIHCTTCRRVRISDCDISCGDDAIAITTLDNPADRVCQGISVTNCVLQSRSAGIRVGHGDGPIRDCTFQNLTIRESNRGLGVFVRDAGSIENILFSNIAIRTRLHTGHWWGNAEPIHLSVLPARKGAPLGRIRNVAFSHIMAESDSGMVIYGDKPGDISGVSLEDVRLHIKASPLNAAYGGDFDLRPAYDTRYAVFRHDIPALFCRHVDGCTISRFDLTWDDNLPDFFDHAVSCEHFRNLVIDGFRGRQPHAGGQKAALSLTDGQNVIIRNCVTVEGTGTFLSHSDLKDGGLLVNNDLRAAKKTFAPDQGDLVLSGNRVPAQP